MSARKVTCPKCRQPFGLLERQLGSDVYCPHCGQKIRIEAPKQPEAATADALQQAAAQQLAELPRQSPGLDSMPMMTPLATGRESDAAADALAALGGAAASAKPSKPSPSVVVRPDKTAQGKAGPVRGVHGREIRTMADMPMVKRGPNPAVVWVMLAVVVLVVGGLIGGIFWVNAYKERQRIEDQAEAQRQEEERNKKALARAAAAEAKAERQKKDALAGGGSPGGMSANGQSEEAGTAVEEYAGAPLTFELVTNEEGNALRRPHGDTKWVIFGFCVNKQRKVVRKAQLTMSVFKGQAKELHHSEVFVFRDVKPGEKVWFAFEYPFTTDENISYQQQMVSAEPEAPECNLELGFPRIASDGRTAGVVSCAVTNRSSNPARKVALFAILKDGPRDIDVVGYAKGEVVNLAPGETVDAKIRWENWLINVQQAEVRAQLVPQP